MKVATIRGAFPNKKVRERYVTRCTFSNSVNMSSWTTIMRALQLSYSVIVAYLRDLAARYEKLLFEGAIGDVIDNALINGNLKYHDENERFLPRFRWISQKFWKCNRFSFEIWARNDAANRCSYLCILFGPGYKSPLRLGLATGYLDLVTLVGDYHF